MTMKRFGLSVMLPGAGVAILASVPAFAHHSFEAEYDRSKSVMLTGTVTKMEWMNPHIYILY
jgi:hypothetical protein